MIWVIFLDSCIIWHWGDCISEISDWICTWNESVEKYLNIIVLLSDRIWNINEKIETFMEDIFVIFLSIH